MWLSRNHECRFYEVHSPNTKEQSRGGEEPHHIHGYRLWECTVHSLSSTLITVKLLGCNAPASSPPALPSKPLPALLLHSVSPLIHLFLSHPSSFLAGGIWCFSVPLTPMLDLRRAASPLCLEASGCSPVTTPQTLSPAPLPPSPLALLRFLFAPSSLLCGNPLPFCRLISNRWKR